jgi:hypothetical protein
LEKDVRKARKRAKTLVESPAFVAKIVDPPPEKSGLVRDVALRRILRDQIERRLREFTNPAVDRDADSFTTSDMNRILKEGPLRMPSGVPIKRVVLLRTMNDPVLIPRKVFDHEQNKWAYDENPRSKRAYVGGNNHHVEIREDAKGKWTGETVPTYEAVRRVRIDHVGAVDHTDDPAKGGKFIMSLSEGDTVYMKLKDQPNPDYFVVFKLDKPQTIQFKYHWDARRAKGEKNEAGELIPESKREEFPITATQLKELAAPGESTPIKVTVDCLGRAMIQKG